MKNKATDKKLFHRLLKAFGVVSEGSDLDALQTQMTNLQEIKDDLVQVIRRLNDKIRVIQAKETIAQRIQPHDRQYLIHLRHCYGEDWEENDGSRFSCKYGQDDICPAATFEDPWKEYLRITEDQKSS